MHSIRTKTTLLTVIAIVVAIAIATTFGVISIRKLGSSTSDEMLLLLCETGEKNLDSYFESMEQSVEMVSSYVQSNLEEMTELTDEALRSHMDHVQDIFAKTASKTSGVLTYYYRIDPSVSEKCKGFWYVNLDGEGFVSHEVTDITLYDTEDTSRLVWFTVPKYEGKAIWLSPYVTDNLNVRVISYNVPIYWRDRFIGVVGIEMDYSTMADQVNHIKLYENGYAFLNDTEGNIIYHPHIDVTEENRSKVPAGLLSNDKFIRYTYEGVEKQAVWLTLSNGMRLNVTVPMSEINASWQGLINEILIVSVVVLVVFVLLTLRLTGQITRPLRELTEAARQVNQGNYDISLNYPQNDEVGILAKAFNQLISHLKVYIGDLSDLAYADALTRVRNKGAFDIHIRQLQDRIDHHETTEFAICIFDCNDLKLINDEYGHEKGDIYLKTASGMICRVFQHSAVFRIGGDEFAAILLDSDYRIRNELLSKFDESCQEISQEADAPWEKANIARGMAVYDRELDRTAENVSRRADMLMYENKRGTKESVR